MNRQDKAAARVTALLFGCALLGMAAYAQEAKHEAAAAPGAESAAAAKAMARQQGIWKWAVPPVRMNGAFDDHDPIGLVAGELIPADCSFNWTDPDTHALYCFTSATSLVYFLDAPQTYEAEAQRSWQALEGKPDGARLAPESPKAGTATEATGKLHP